MSATLCRYPAEQVYIPEYRSATEEIATRRLRLGTAPDADELADALLDPDYPAGGRRARGGAGHGRERVEAGWSRAVRSRSASGC